MITLKTILFPTDFSDFSLFSLDYAASFAQRYGAKLVFLHVVDLFLSDPAYFAPYVPTEAMFEEIREKSRARLEEIAATRVPGGIPTDIAVVQGRPFVEIVREAKERRADLIVLSTHGRTGLSHAMFGSTAEKVVRKAPCPVLSVRRPGHGFTMP